MFDNYSQVLERKHGSPKQPPVKMNSAFAPHADTMHDWTCLFAATIWLNLPEECHGGTGFWKNKFMDTEFYYYHESKETNFLLDKLKGLPCHKKKV